MSNRINPSTADAAAAIDEILVAETAAREAMEACSAEAEAILEAARESARRTTRRATERITRLHQHCDALLQTRIAEVRKAAHEGAVRTELNAADRERLAKAVQRLATRLTRPGDG